MARKQRRRSIRSSPWKGALLGILFSLFVTAASVTAYAVLNPERVFYTLFDLPPGTFERIPQFRFHSFFPPSVELIFDDPLGVLSVTVSPQPAFELSNIGAHLKIKATHKSLPIQIEGIGEVEYGREGIDLQVTIGPQGLKSPWITLLKPLSLAGSLDPDFMPRSAHLLAPSFRPLALDSIREIKPALQFGAEVDLDFTGPEWLAKVVIAEPRSSATVPLTLQFNPQTRKGTGKGRLRLAFGKDLQPKLFLPELDSLGSLEGTIDCQSGARFSLDQTPHIDFLCRMDRMKGTLQSVPFKDLSTKLTGTALPKFKLTAPVRIDIAQIGDLVYLDDFVAIAKVDLPKMVRVERAEGKILKGSIRVTPFDIDLKTRNMKSRIDLTGLDLGLLLRAINPNVMQGAGVVDGKIPLRLEQGRLLIESAILNSRGAGWIALRDELATNMPGKIDTLDEFNALLAQGTQVLAFKALQNFQFSTLSLSAHRTMKEGMEAELKLKGKNPDLAKGQAFELNLPITGNVEQLVVQTLLGSFAEGVKP